MNAKIVFSFLLLTLSLSAAAQQNSFWRYLAQNMSTRTLALTQLTAKRCSLYLPYEYVNSCEQTVARMYADLDHDMVTNPDGSFIFVIRKHRLLGLLASEKTGEFLTDYLSDPSDLWHSAMKHFTTVEESAKNLAVLFQDTSERRLHLLYVERSTPGRTTALNLEKLSLAIDLINQKKVGALYPPDVPDLGKEIYHFYVPFHLALNLKQHQDMAYIAPLFMTLTYEFVTSADDYRYLLKDPKTLSSEHKIRDIFRGHSGAAYAVGKSTVEFESLKFKFESSVKKAVEALLAID